MNVIKVLVGGIHCPAATKLRERHVFENKDRFAIISLTLSHLFIKLTHCGGLDMVDTVWSMLLKYYLCIILDKW